VKDVRVGRRRTFADLVELVGQWTEVVLVLGELVEEGESFLDVIDFVHWFREVLDVLKDLLELLG